MSTYVAPLSQLGNGSIKIVVHVVFCDIRVLSKESTRLVLPRTSCNALPLFIQRHVLWNYCMAYPGLMGVTTASHNDNVDIRGHGSHIRTILSSTRSLSQNMLFII
jgi:hypothetical protein